MVVSVEDHQYMVEWMYNPTTEITSCVIRFDDDSLDVCGTSCVKRYYRDTPSLYNACKYALAKALSTTGFNKSVRTVFWGHFKTRRDTGLRIS